ncbi:MAG: hypothetical protein U9O98_05035 [Asgard group archaeon]|nr:hypothetical protein [Asgard group archaeon]
MTEKSDLHKSAAFKEYAYGRNKKIRPPWLWIILTGVLTAFFSLGTVFIAVLLTENPWSYNFIIGLYGIPAGFIVGYQDETGDFMNSAKFAFLSSIFYDITYFLISLIFMQFTPQLMAIFVTIIKLFYSFLIIALYALIMFIIGGILSTFFRAAQEGKIKVKSDSK